MTTRAELADELEAAANSGTRFNNEETGQLVRKNLKIILAALRAEPDADAVERVAKAICQSGKFECGQGACSLFCLGQLGDARKRPCQHAFRIHGDLAKLALAAMPQPIAPSDPERRALIDMALDIKARCGNMVQLFHHYGYRKGQPYSAETASMAGELAALLEREDKQ